MTTQVREKIFYKGERLEMFTTPLEDFFSQMEGGRPDFGDPPSCLWRGYIGTWEILGDRLFLLNFNSTLRDGTKVSTKTYFPEFTEKVFAEWYSGTLKIGMGGIIQTIYIYQKVYEKDLFIDIQKGVVVGTKIVENEEIPEP